MRPNKYNARKTPYRGVTYDSAREAKYAFELDMRKRAGQIDGWERQVPIKLHAHGKPICTYKIDFVVYRNGITEYVEVKGYETDVWKLKWKLFAALMAVEQPDAMLSVIK